MKTYSTDGQRSPSDPGHSAGDPSLDFWSAQGNDTDPGPWFPGQGSGFDLLASDAGSLRDTAAALYYIGLSNAGPSKPSGHPEEAHGGSSAVTAPTTATLEEEWGSGYPEKGPPGIDLFARKFTRGGGGNGGGSGGTPTPTDPLAPYSYTSMNKTITLNVSWDSSASSAPSGFVSGFETAAQTLIDTLSGPIGASTTTINIAVGWGTVGGQTISPFALGQSSTNVDPHSYAELKAKMSYLPLDATNGAGTFWVPSAQEKALGLGTTSSSDGAVGFSSGFSWNFTGSPAAGSGQYDFQAVVKHEVSEVMGRISVLGASVGGIANSYTPYDLFRYTDVGVQSLVAGANSYFSFDGGVSSTGHAADGKAYFNTVSGGDWGDWAGSGLTATDAYVAFANSGTPYTTGAVDQLVMDALGYGSLNSLIV